MHIAHRHEIHIVTIRAISVHNTFVVPRVTVSRLVCLAPALVSIVYSDMPKLCATNVKYVPLGARVARH
jgi:hypothetical protein